MGMCRSISDGGRRCPCTNTASSRSIARAASNRYYARGKAAAKVAQLADAGIAAVTDRDMPTMYQMTSKGAALAVAGKGPAGAVWATPGRTSSTGAAQTAWTDAAAAHTGEQPEGTLRPVTAAPGAVIVIVSTAEDAEAVVARYGTVTRKGATSVNWSAMRNDGIDAVSISQECARTAGPSAAASTVWLSKEHMETGASMPVRDYTFADDPAGGPRRPAISNTPLDEPQRRPLPSAWDRVPARLQHMRKTAGEKGTSGATAPTRAAEQGQQSARGRQDPVTSPAGAPRRVGNGGGTPGPDGFEALAAFVGASVMFARRRGRSSKKRTATSRGPR